MRTWYSKLGSDSSAIMGYSIINNYLAAHKDSNELTQSILLREGDLVDDKPTFKLINTLQGAGAISKYCFCYLETEPLFLTKLGIYAVTAQDITGEKYAQDRSYYIDGKLLNEESLKDAFAYTFEDLYLLCVNSHVYVLDGLQPMQTDKSKPYATRQYAGFYWTNIPAKCMIGTDYIRNAVIIAFITNEVISIIENAGLMGVPVPDVIKKGIDILQKKGDSVEKSN